LKSDEWHTTITIYLLVALISLWGERTLHISTDKKATHLWCVLNHTMCLVSAVQLACIRTMTTSCAKPYHQYMAAWVSELTTLHPHVTARPNGHMALHIYDFYSFLVLFILGGASLSSTSLGCFSIYWTIINLVCLFLWGQIYINQFQVSWSPLCSSCSLMLQTFNTGWVGLTVLLPFKNAINPSMNSMACLQVMKSIKVFQGVVFLCRA
jgi:hypothetical protein